MSKKYCSIIGYIFKINNLEFSRLSIAIFWPLALVSKYFLDASVFSFTHSLRVGRDYLVNSTQLYDKTRLSYTNLCLLCYKKIIKGSCF